MARIGIYGGSFDPPTRGHMEAIGALLASGLVDQVWVAPSGDARYDRAPTLPARVRLSLLRQALNNHNYRSPRVRVELAHLLADSKHSSTDALISLLKAEYPQHDFRCVIGADNLPKVPTWKNFKKLLKKCDFLVIPRRGVPLPSVRATPWASIVPMRTPSGDSSTKLRSLLASNGSIVACVPRGLARATKKAWRDNFLNFVKKS